jgi:hypothetical protein
MMKLRKAAWVVAVVGAFFGTMQVGGPSTASR